LLPGFHQPHHLEPATSLGQIFPQHPSLLCHGSLALGLFPGKSAPALPGARGRAQHTLGPDVCLLPYLEDVPVVELVLRDKVSWVGGVCSFFIITLVLLRRGLWPLGALGCAKRTRPVFSQKTRCHHMMIGKRGHELLT
jgi:hypothetical protein